MIATRVLQRDRMNGHEEMHSPVYGIPVYTIQSVQDW